MNSYRFFDYQLDSTHPLPELQLAPETEQPAAIITLTAMEHQTESFEHRHRWEDSDMQCSFGQGRYCLFFPGILDARIDVDNARVEYQVNPAAADAAVRHLLLDQVLPRMLSHRGELVLHGSCVTKQDATIAFVGTSGAGKSSLAASFSQNGWQVLSDDCLLVRQDRAGAIVVYGSYPGIRLHESSAVALLGGSTTTSMASGIHQKRRYQVAPETQGKVLTLLVSLDESGLMRSTPLEGAIALQTLLAESYSLDPSDHDAAEKKLRRIAVLVEQVPRLISLSYPRSFSELTAVRSHIVQRLNP